MQTVEQPPGWRGDCEVPVTVGYYPCDKPPTLGIQFVVPGSNDINGPVFNIEPEAFKLVDNGNNNCTSNIVGRNDEKGGWEVGNAWWQGKYVDCQGLYGIPTGVAVLKDKTAGAAKASKDNAASGLRPSGSIAVLGAVAMLSLLW